MEEAKCEQCNYNIQHVLLYIHLYKVSSLPTKSLATRLPVTMTVDDHYIELCTDIHWYLYMYTLLCLTCFIKYFCIPGMQAEATLPVVTQTKDL